MCLLQLWECALTILGLNRLCCTESLPGDVVIGEDGQPIENAAPVRIGEDGQPISTAEVVPPAPEPEVIETF